MHRCRPALRLLMLTMLALVLPLTQPTTPCRAGTITVTILAPPHEDNPFWNDYISFMSHAADDLGITLTVANYQQRFDEVRVARKILSGPGKPDYLLHLYYAQNTLDILEMAEEAGVKSILCNTDVLPADRNLVGYPRDKFPHWVAHIYPDDESAGRMLADDLIQQGRELGMADAAGQLHVIGLGANRETTATLYREAGLRSSVESHPDATLERFVHTNWDRDLSRDKATQLMLMYPHADVWWGVHDGTAFGILDAAGTYGLRAGTDVVVGGIDWSPEGIRAVVDGRLHSTCGGHFMGGAWALVLALDHHNGYDCSTSACTFRSQMRLITRETLPHYAPVLNRDNWERIDFKRFTRTHNPALTAYDFSPDSVVRELERSASE